MKVKRCVHTLHSTHRMMLAKIIVALVAFVCVASAARQDSCSGVADTEKKDCGVVGTSQSECQSSGCCWQAQEDGSATPWCFHPAASSSDYTLSNMEKVNYGYQGTLKIATGASSDSLSTLQLQLVFETVDTFRIRITDPVEKGVAGQNDGGKWEVPQSVISRPTPEQVAPLKEADLNYAVHYDSAPFRFRVERKSDKAVLFELLDGFIYQDQFIQIGTSFDSNAKTYGLGESTRLNQALHQGTYTMWATDIAAATFNVNLYGSFPFYLQMSPDGTSHGALLMNSNGIDAVLGADSLTFKTIGGIIDMYIFSGSSPKEVVKQYTNVVGKPMMLPYWSLGFHNCKYGYTGLTQVQEVVAGYEAAGIPLDTQWMDIDYMQDYRDWTWSAGNFDQKQVGVFVDGLHDKGMHFVPIVDPGIMVYAGYDAYEQGVKDQLYIKDITNKDFYLGQVWPGPVNFPDFLHPKTQSYWTKSVKGFHDNVKVDGLWIDMNEISNFCNYDGSGQVCTNPDPANCPTGQLSTQTTCCLSCETIDSSNKYDFPPYHINNAQGNGALGAKTVAPSAWHHNNVSDYNVHNIYGLTEQIATNAALTDVRGERPFLLTRSSFVSSGKHTAKWTGDNSATWDDLKSSIISVMDFNLFGVPMIGADICGFLGDTTEELCARWIEVGAFYPFSRNHNALGSADQELYLWPSVTAAAKYALGIRYQILPYMYTLLYQAHAAGETVARSLWLNFPADKATFEIDSQFMLGSGLLISPVLDAGATSVTAYFPKGLWYDFTSHALAVDASVSAQERVLDTPLTSVNVHLLGGTVLPQQGAAVTTTAARETPFKLVVALCPKGGAFGELFVDDGIQVDSAIPTNSLLVQYKASNSNSLVGSIVSNTYSGAAKMNLGEVNILGVRASPATATLNGKDISSSMHYDASTKELRFTGLLLAINEELDLHWA